MSVSQNNVNMNELRELLRRGLEEGVYTAAVLHVRREDEVVLEVGAGHTRRDRAVPITLGTCFDLASLTKVVSTTAMVMRLYERGVLRLDDPLGRWVPKAPADKAALPLRRLLSHTSGLPAWRPFFEVLEPLARAGEFAQGRRRLLEAVLAEPVEAAPGAQHVYSDLGFMLLGLVLEAAGGMRLDALFRREVAEPLALRDTFFVDLGDPRARAAAHAGRTFAATEECPWRCVAADGPGPRTALEGPELSGVVHDDNCYCAGGILGHAGLFASARDVGSYASALLAVDAGRSTWLRAETLAAFAEVDPDHVGGAHALGFDVSQPPGSQAGLHLGGAIGHLGFTGTSVWIDRHRRLGVVLLTNRVHPTRDNPLIRTFRPALHDALIAALGE